MKTKSGNLITNPQVRDKLWKGWVQDAMSSELRKQKELAKIERRNSEEYLTSQTARDIAQFMTGNKSNLINQMRELAKEIAQKIIKQISTELQISDKAKKVNNYTQPHLTIEQIEKVMNDYMPALKKLRTLCENENIIPTIKTYPTIYDNMFIALFELDSRFAFFAPKFALNHSKVKSKVECMTEENQEKLESYFENINGGDFDYVDDYTIENDEICREDVLKIVDHLAEEEFKARFEMVEVVEKTAGELYKFIIKQLNLKNIDETTLKYQDINRVLTLCGVGIKSLQTYSDDVELNKISGWEKFDPHTELFNRLMDLNLKFAFFSPKKSLNRLDIDFKRLSEKERNIMLKVLIDYGLWDNDEFYENYHSLFDNNFSNNV